MAAFAFGKAIRETGQALDRLGCRIGGSVAFKEQLSRHRTIMPFYDHLPNVPATTFVAPNAAVIGNVSIGAKSSIWYGCVLRGDKSKVTIGSMTNIQDNSTIHNNSNQPTTIGSRVTVGHNSVLHACTIEDEAFVGMGATVMDGVTVSKGSMVAAGAVVTNNTVVPTGEIWAGNPAKLLRKLTEQETSFLGLSAENYASLSEKHMKENAKSFEQIEQEKSIRKENNERGSDYDQHLGIERPPTSTVPSL